MMPYKDVKQKFGASIASQILQEKQTLEKDKKPGDSTIYFMHHPEAKGNEESHLHYCHDHTLNSEPFS